MSRASSTRILISASILAALLAACAAKPQIRGHSSYASSKFNRATIETHHLALLPIVAGAGVEGYRRPFGDAINQTAAELLPEGSFLAWQETMDLLNDAGLVESYQEAISAYASTSIVPRRLIQRMSDATGAKYFMYVSLNPPISHTQQRLSVWGSGLATETHVGVSANGLVWAASGDVVWEGSGTSEISASSDAFQTVPDQERDLAVHSRRAANALFRAMLSY